MKIVNLTPHDVNIFRSMEDIAPMMVIPPSGIVARVASVIKQFSNVDGIPIFSFEFGEVVDMPKQESGTIYIVSAILLDHKSMKNRMDVFAPGELKRNEKGQPIGCIGLRC